MDNATTGSNGNLAKLREVAEALVAPGKGILAADESDPTIAKRFRGVGLESTPETRRDYRATLFSTPGLGKQISGTILFDETLRQHDPEGVPLVELLRQQGIIPGIKVDKGVTPMAGFPGDRLTQGLDGLAERLSEYVRLGARFSKWRAVIQIGDGIPSETCLEANAFLLARFAAESQQAGLVPIVEPEVLMDGPHPIGRHFQVTEAALTHLFHALYKHRVELEAVLLKPNMVLAGTGCPEQAGIREVAETTLRCMRRNVPAAVPGLVFLSGGQSAELATRHLNAMNAIGQAPWELSFSFGRALQAPALAAWSSGRERVQKALQRRAACNGAARSGAYTDAMERSPL